MVSDVQNDDFVGGHATVPLGLGSWLSHPIHVQGAPAGSICALQREARAWTAAEAEALRNAASQISEAVEEWIASA
jgi:GAF domain-containing protein